MATNPSPLTAGHERGEAVYERLKPAPRCLVNHLSAIVEHLCGARYHDPAAEPRSCTKRPQDRKPCGLGERSTCRSRSRTYDGDWPAAEYLGNVDRRPGQPINRILQHARYRIVVFGCDDQETVCLGYSRLQLLHRRRNALG